MLIQRRPPCSTTSTFGSALGSARTSPRERVERRSRGFGRFGMAASKRVVDHRRHGALILSVAKDSTRAGRNLNQSGGNALPDGAGRAAARELCAAGRGGRGHLVVVYPP